jgi:hypothetical protein
MKAALKRISKDNVMKDLRELHAQYNKPFYGGDLDEPFELVITRPGCEFSGKIKVGYCLGAKV